jgi:tetratricopeptide (TPR) repeat protein
MPQLVMRFNLTDDTGSFDALARALRRETGVVIVRLDEEQWVISASEIERPVTALFRGDDSVLREVRLWLDRLGVREIDLVLDSLAAEMTFSKGLEYRRQEMNEKALDWFDRTLAIDDSAGGAWSNRANVLADLKRWDEAEYSYRRALECTPPDKLIHFNFGVYLVSRGQYEAGVVELHEALRLDPEFEPAKLAVEGLETIASNKDNFG